MGGNPIARIAGRNCRVYVDVSGASNAALVPFIKSWSHDRSVDRFDVTAYGDTNKAYVQGLPDATGSYSGFWDDSTVQFYTAATDGVSRKTYVYPNISDPTKYFYGYAFYDTSEEFPVDGASTISGSWAADGAWSKVG